MHIDNEIPSSLEQALSAMTKEDYLEILSTIDPIVWVESKRILKGKPFSFKNREYLLEPYRDNYHDLIFYKGRQVEMSEFSMNWILNKMAKHPYTVALHAFPRQNQAQKFSKQRLDAAIKDSKFISEWYDDRNSDQLMRKFLGKPDKNTGLTPYNFYILGATWESRKDTVGDAARSVSIDYIVYDERQDHPNDVETVLGEGASHSEFGDSLTLGTPKLPGTQFDQQWESSDKRFWHVTCEHCGWTDPITMDNILDSGDDEIGYYYGCPRCKKPIKRNVGKWLPTNPHKRPAYHGYHINQLMVCWMDANKIMKKYNSKTYPKRRFHNEVLGFAYGGDDVPITWQMMEACAKNDYSINDSIDSGLYVGVDWGASSYCWVQQKTVLGHKLIDVLICGESDPREHPKKIARWLKRYNPMVRNIVCDAGPDITRANNLRDECKKEGICAPVWACYYATPPAKTEVTWNEKENNVTVGRSEAIEGVIDEVADAFLIIPGKDKELERIDMAMEHFTNIAAERAETSSGNEFIMYVATGPDHFLHAKVYADVASSGAKGIALGGSAGSFIQKRNQEENFKKARPSSSKFPKFERRRR